MQSIRLKIVLGLALLVLVTLALGVLGYLNTGPDAENFVLISTVTGTLLALIIALLVFRSALSPLMRIISYSTRIANGNYGAPFEGACSGEFSQLKEAIDVIAGEATEKSAQVEDLDNQLAMARHETERVSQELEEAQAEAKAQSDALIKGAGNLKELADMLNDSTVGLSDQVGIITDGANSQRERSAESATGMDQMNASILDVARSASQAAELASAARDKAINGAKVVDQVTEAVATVDDHTSHMEGSVNGLGKQAEDIGYIMSVITDIADQTNLLALNAAIEAARAGDAGRGFAVVADEVRKLAEKTMSATKEVADAVQAIQGGVSGSIDEMSKAATAVEKARGLAADADAALKEIVSIVETSADQVQAIATAAEEQSAASEEITRAVDDVSQTSTIIVHGMDESRAMIGNVTSYTAILADIIEDMADGDMTSIEQRDWSSLSATKAAPAPATKPATTQQPTQSTSRKSTSLMEWSDDFVIGLKEIDDQHRKLVDLINKLNTAMKTGKGKDVLAQIFADLRDYTVNHFAYEEAMFEKHKYPGTVAHVAAHKKLVNSVLELEEKFLSGKAVLTNEVMHFLKDWLVTHIQGTDRKYVPHMLKAGVGGEASTPASATPKTTPKAAPAARPSHATKSLMEWSDAFEIGIQEIDEQHYKLVKLVNQLNTAMKEGKGAGTLGEVFDELKDYTVHHFATEEALFEEHNYPGTVAHEALHKKLVETVLDLEEQFKSGKAALTNDVMRFLKDWLVKHIQVEDRKYVAHLHKAGVK